MTKEELIALSDLNREDNIKYISSEAQGIAIALDSDRYAPALCKLERAYICGRRKSENYIADLEKENAGIKAGRPKWHKVADGDLPKPNVVVLICLQFEKRTTTYIAYYRPAIKKWQMYNMHEAQRQPIVDDYIDSDEVIAWCEIPQYTEE